MGCGFRGICCLYLAIDHRKPGKFQGKYAGSEPASVHRSAEFAGLTRDFAGQKSRFFSFPLLEIVSLLRISSLFLNSTQSLCSSPTPISVTPTIKRIYLTFRLGSTIKLTERRLNYLKKPTESREMPLLAGFPRHFGRPEDVERPLGRINRGLWCEFPSNIS